MRIADYNEPVKILAHVRVEQRLELARIRRERLTRLHHKIPVRLPSTQQRFPACGGNFIVEGQSETEPEYRSSKPISASSGCSYSARARWHRQSQNRWQASIDFALVYPASKFKPARKRRSASDAWTR